MMVYLGDHQTLEGCSTINEKHLDVFDCANRCGDGSRYIKMMGHLKMMAAIQPYLSGAISKTVNFPEEVTIEDFKSLYMKSWKMGLKSIAPYRNNCKAVQPLQSKEKSEKSQSKKIKRYHMGSTRLGVTHKIEIASFTGYLQVGLKKDLTPGEIFIKASKEGSTISGLLDAFATSISYNLQYGVPLSSLCRKFKNSRFDPAGVSPLGIVTSIIDYIFKWLESNFLDENGEPAPATQILSLMYLDNDLLVKMEQEVVPSQIIEKVPYQQKRDYDGPLCDECGHITQRSGASCWVCTNCMTKHGCS